MVGIIRRYEFFLVSTMARPSGPTEEIKRGTER